VDAVKFFSKDYEEFKLIYEGKSGVISLSHDPADGAEYKRYLRLKTSGLNESIYTLDNLETLPKYEALLGFLPYSLVRNPQSAFLVGYGGGYTTDFLTRSTLKKVHVVELEEGVLKAADIVYEGKNPILQRPNLELDINDARYILASQPGRSYDMILSQPSHSWLTGVANLFTREFFEIVRSRLSDKGIFSQWLNLYNMDPTVLKSILRTFYEVFPYGAVFTQLGDQEMILIGSVRPVELNLRKMEQLARDAKLGRQLSQIPFQSGYDVAAQISLSRGDVLKSVGDARINTDVNAYAEVGQTRLFYQKPGADSDPQAFLEGAFTGDYSEVVHIAESGLPALYEGVLRSLKEQRKYSRMLTVLANYERATLAGTLDADAYSRLGYWCLQAERYQSASKYLAESLKLKSDPRTLQLLLGAQVSLRDFVGAASLVTRGRAQLTDASRCFAAHALVENGGVEKARAAFAPLESDAAKYKEACGSYYDRVMGTYRLAQNRYRDAIPYLEAYYAAFASDVRIISGLVASYIKIEDWDNAKSFSAYLQQAIDQDARHRTDMGAMFRKKGWNEDAEGLEKLKL
jgi:spermidine synthase/Flp pilus assembly protein TadD